MTSNPNTSDQSLRSVFVCSIPYDIPEEKLKDIFSRVGPVLSFKLIYDRESGKHKGYGYCEYKDQVTALSAIKNLNQYKLNGRNLQVLKVMNKTDLLAERQRMATKLRSIRHHIFGPKPQTTAKSTEKKVELNTSPSQVNAINSMINQSHRRKVINSENNIIIKVNFKDNHHLI